jgi:exodeoxyribonuclease VIII
MSTETMPTVAPGLRPVPYEEYARWQAAHHSMLRAFARSALHAHEWLIRPPDQSDAQALGSAAHCAILEPERFEASYVAAPKIDKRFKAGKLEWAEFQGRYPNHEIVTQDEYDSCLRMRDAVYAHPTARELLSGPGKNEHGALWQDPDTGLMVKCRPDRIAALAGWPVVVDLKTTRDARRTSFAKDIHYFQYHEQAALYLDGLDVLSPHPRKFVFIALEKEPPYAVAVYELDDEAIVLGRDEYKAHLNTYGECVRSGIWPGYGDGMDYVSLPAWAFRPTQGD